MAYVLDTGSELKLKGICPSNCSITAEGETGTLSSYVISEEDRTQLLMGATFTISAGTGEDGADELIVTPLPTE